MCACAALVTYVIATRSEMLKIKLKEDWSEMCKNKDVIFVACLMFKNIGIVDTNNYSVSKTKSNLKTNVNLITFYQIFLKYCFSQQM